MKTFTITVSGDTQSDVETAIEEALKKIRSGNTSGFDSNDSGNFSFESDGEYVSEDETRDIDG